MRGTNATDIALLPFSIVWKIIRLWLTLTSTAIDAGLKTAELDIRAIKHEDTKLTRRMIFQSIVCLSYTLGNHV